MNWISVEKKLPKIGQAVLCFYTIGKSEYYCVGKIEQINISQTSETEAYKNVEWYDTDHNCIIPTHWCKITPTKMADTEMTVS